MHQDNIATLVQKEFEMLGITNVKGKRIDAERSAIHRTVAEALADYNVIMIIGGMGAENENMTPSAVSAAIGFQTINKEGEAFPEGAEIFKSSKGKPSGCAVSQGNQCIIMLPGDRDTFQFMLCYRVSRYLADFVGGAYSLKTLRATGITKAEAEETVSICDTEGTAVRIYEDNGEIAIQLYARGVDRKEAHAKVNSAIKEIAAKLGSSAYAIDAENVGQAFGKELSKKDLKVAIALEGIQRTEIASIAYTDEYLGSYLGASYGIERYNIPEKLLKHHGSNSTWTAAVLAGEVCKNYGSNIGIAITTDPTKSNDGANIAVCMGDNVWTEHITEKTREELLATAGARAVHIARSVASAYPKLYENSVSLMGAVYGKSKFKTAKTEAGKRKWYQRFIPAKGDSKTDLIRKIIFIVSILVFIGSMGYLGTKLMDSVDQDRLAISISDKVNSELSDKEKAEAKKWGYNEKLYTLFKENNDLMAYIKIDNTNVDFAVVQTAKANESGLTGQYYLRKDFYGNKSMYGTPFLDYRCNADPENQSTNLIVYGHNVYDDGKMFSDLIKYRRLKFYKEHPVVHFDTLYGDKDWLVVGVILTNAYEKDGPVWNYNNFINGDEEQTKDFISQIAKRTMIVTGVDYNTSDRFLTLSTCSYDFKDARVVIIARQVREGEDISVLDTDKAYYNKNPLMPDKWYQTISEAQKSENDASFGEPENVVASENEEIESVEVIQAPTKLTYKIGESMNAKGLILGVYKKDGSFEEVKSGFELVQNGPFTSLGKQTVSIIYKDFEISFSVEVTDEQSTSQSSESKPEVKATEIEIINLPKKLTYKVGEKLDLKGLIVRVYKSDNSFEDLTDNYDTLEFTPLLKNPLEKTGKQKVKIRYKENKDYFDEFEIKVEEQSSSETSTTTSSETSTETSSEGESAVASISVVGSPAKTSYTVGETLDTAGLVICVTKENGTSENITSGFDVAPKKLNTAGTIMITVTYQGASAVFTVTVEEEEPFAAQVVNIGKGQSTQSTPSYGKSSSYYSRSLTDTVRLNGITMSVFDAVCQIVAYEAGYGQPNEHVKAQAVATYTFIMYHNGSLNAGVKTNVTQQIKECVAEVIGYAVLDDKSNKYILATYFSESCGDTADAQWVWGYPNRNLLSVSSPVDGYTSKTYTISSSEFKNKVQSKAGITLTGDPSRWISIDSRWGYTDYVNKITLGTSSYTGRKLRETVLGNSKLRSTAFDVYYDGGSDSFVFTMRGYGHGVGLSAIGSINYAKQGYKWDDILLKYYSNCYISMKY